MDEDEQALIMQRPKKAKSATNATSAHSQNETADSETTDNETTDSNPSAALVIDHSDQKQFEQLTQQINQQRAVLQKWEQAASEFDQHYAAHYMPLLQTYHQQRIELVEHLDYMWGDKLFSHADRDGLSALICQLLGHLGVNQNAKLERIFSEHSPNLQLQAHDDVDIRTLKSPDDAHHDWFDRDWSASHLEAKRQAQAMRQQKQKQKRKQTSDDHQQPLAFGPDAHEIQAQQASQSLRQVYRQLVGALHPDRELDLGKKEEKTEWMKQINLAYEQSDLLTLLSLQLECEHITQIQPDYTDERLPHFNRVLQDQLQEIQSQVDHIKARYLSFLNWPARRELLPDMLVKRLHHTIDLFKKELRQFHHTKAFFEDVKNIKQWLVEQGKDSYTTK